MHFFEADSVVVQHLHTKFFYLAWNCVCCYVYNGWQAWYKTQARRTANTHRLFTSFLPWKEPRGIWQELFRGSGTRHYYYHYALLISSSAWKLHTSTLLLLATISTFQVFLPPPHAVQSLLNSGHDPSSFSSYSCAFSSWWVQQKSYM